MDNSLLKEANAAIREFLNTDAGDCDEEEYGRIYQKANIGLRIRDQLVNAGSKLD